MERPVLILALLGSTLAGAQQMHDHPAPEKLGTVSFPTSCKAEVQPEFNRGVALLHSFAYKAADLAFESVARRDARCAIAHWGRAMTHYHQLWDLPPSPADTSAGEKEIGHAVSLGGASAREQSFVLALSRVFSDPATTSYSNRALNYEAAMHDLAAANPNDVESQVFYALALLSNASPSDKEHLRQKQALSLLEPLFARFPDHPGIPHYVIHACDNQELASRGLAAARLYAGIAPSAPHALHMPSHIFTRLGLWEDSIHSNLAAKGAAERESDTGEALHAMDYLVYAYLQGGHDQEASDQIQELKAMPNLHMGDFKAGYAATVMPVRYLMERGRWAEAGKVANPPVPAQPQVVAIAAWARGVGLARSGRGHEAGREAETLREIEAQLHGSGNNYWATQVGIMRQEVAAWSAQAMQQSGQAAALLRSAADDEDAIEKLPLTPGPIIPAREQLGDLLLEQHDSTGAGREFKAALANAPGRRGAIQGEARAEHPPSR